MNTRKTIYNKLFKEETQLASHEVELALINDIMKQNDLLKNELKKSDQLRKDISVASFNLKQSKKTLLNYLNDLDNKASNLNELLKKVEIASKELGISPGDVYTYAKNTIENIKMSKNADIKTYDLNNLK